MFAMIAILHYVFGVFFTVFVKSAADLQLYSFVFLHYEPTMACFAFLYEDKFVICAC